MNDSHEKQFFTEINGEMVVDPEAMAPPSRVIPEAGRERMASEQLASMHPEFTSQGRDAATLRAEQDTNSENPITAPDQVASKVNEIRQMQSRVIGAPVVRQESGQDQGQVAKFHEYRDKVQKPANPRLKGPGDSQRP